MSYIQWGGKRWYQPKPQPRKPDINELMKPLSEKVGTGNIWGSVIMNVPKEEAPPVETFYLQTAQGDNLQTAQGDNILWTT